MKCRVCEEEKPLERFTLIKKTEKYDPKCKDCKNEYQKQRRVEKPESFKKALKKWYETKGRKWKKEYEEKNREKINAADRLRYKTNPDYRTKKILRTRLSSTINGTKKYNKVLQQLVIPIPLFKEWIEFQFTEEMNWENQGSYWTFDHVIPLDYFIKNKINDGMHHWSNLRPQVGKENFSKNNKIDKDLIKDHYSINVSTFIGFKELEIDTVVQRLQRKWVIEN